MSALATKKSRNYNLYLIYNKELGKTWEAVSDLMGRGHRKEAKVHL